MSNGGPGGVGGGVQLQQLAPLSTAAVSAERRRSSDDDNPSSKAEETSEQSVSRKAFVTGATLNVSA